VTAFIPNNAAFQAISNLLGNLTLTEIGGILLYHLVPNVTAYSTDLMNGTVLESSIGENITITIDGDSVFVNQAKVVVPNVLCQEGVIHVIDAVLNPSNATVMPDVSETGGVAAFPGATSGSTVPYTSGISAPTSVPPAATAGGAGGGSSNGGSGGAESTSSSDVAALPMVTGAMGAAALFGGAAVVLNM
jgi:hypothetical protein